VKMPGATGGSFVRSIDHESFGEMLRNDLDRILKLGSLTYEELIDVRCTLDIAATRAAVLHRTDDDLAILDKVVEQQRTETWDSAPAPGFDVNFHELVARASKNRALTAILTALHRSTVPAHHDKMNARTGQEIYKQHAEIVAAIRTQDQSSAEAAVVAHFRYMAHDLRSS
jgi:GntR family transcriptional regulator, transcriptional repressor for pyruvate dehydrogenase complex